LPTPGSPIRTGFDLVPAAHDADHPPDLIVAADDGVELALLGEGRQVAAILLEELALA
jgi:hypothetical protein